jgi:uncharacterized membrane protein YhaH (DUF805 family)
MSTARNHHSVRSRRRPAYAVLLADIAVVVGTAGAALAIWWLVTPFIGLLGHFSASTSPLHWLQPAAVNALSFVCLSSWLVTTVALVLRRLRDTEQSLASLISLLVPVLNFIVLVRLAAEGRAVRRRPRRRTRHRLAG